jgi:hypothetical protein
VIELAAETSKSITRLGMVEVTHGCRLHRVTERAMQIERKDVVCGPNFINRLGLQRRRFGWQVSAFSIRLASVLRPVVVTTVSGWNLAGRIQSGHAAEIGMLIGRMAV